MKYERLKEYAARHGIHYRTAWNWYKAGKIPGAEQVNGIILVPLEEVDSTEVNLTRGDRVPENPLPPKQHAEARAKALSPEATQGDVVKFISSMKPRLGWDAHEALTQLAQAFLAVGPPPERIRELAESEAYATSNFTISPFHATLWRYRLPLLVKQRGWEMDGMERRYFSDSIYAVDLGDYTPAATDEGDALMYCAEEDYVVQTRFFASSNYFQVQIHCGPRSDRPAKDIFKELSQAVTKPNPYEGRVISLHSKGDVTLVELRAENLSPYGDDVERSVAWALSVFNDEVAERLSNKGLSRKNGLLLEGTPGSGKTTLVRRIAKEREGEVTTIYIAPGTSVKQALEFAREFTKPLVVLEDVESHFGKRGEGSFTEFLNAIDGVENNQVMAIIATTNDSSAFDPAVVRPGRLEERATINAIHGEAMITMMRERFDEDDAMLERLIPILSRRAKDDGGGYLTPAIIDGLARRAIIMNLSGEKLLTYAEEEWGLSTHGESYLEGSEDDEDDEFSLSFEELLKLHSD